MSADQQRPHGSSDAERGSEEEPIVFNDRRRIDPETGEVVEYSATNVPVAPATEECASDPTYTTAAGIVDDAVEVARRLEGRGVDLVDVSSGGNVIADIPAEKNYQVPFAQAIRERSGVATGAVGLITEPAQAEAILTEGHADAVLLGRAALREPYWPLRAAAELGLTWRETPYPAQYTRGAWEHARG